MRRRLRLQLRMKVDIGSRRRRRDDERLEGLHLSVQTFQLHPSPVLLIVNSTIMLMLH